MATETKVETVEVPVVLLRQLSRVSHNRQAKMILLKHQKAKFEAEEKAAEKTEKTAAKKKRG